VPDAGDRVSEPKLWQGSVRCPSEETCRFKIYVEGDSEEEIDAGMTEAMLGHVDRQHPEGAVTRIEPGYGGVVIPKGLTGEEEDIVTEVRPRLVN
jgi:hypothetical protein